MQKLSQIFAVLVAATVTLLLGAGSAAAAEPQDNQNWGEVASNTAQLDTDGIEGSGGAMGRHSKSTTAANNTGGFAADGNDFGITFNEENVDGNHGRDGVGNVSEDVHGTAPGDGGNGQHAVNNAELAEILNPIDGQFTTNLGGTSEDVSDELAEGTTLDPEVDGGVPD